MNLFLKSKLNPLSMLNCATFFQYQRFVMPISFLFYLHNGLTFSQFILCQSIFNATCLIGKILFGVIGDIISKKYVIIFAYLLFLLRVVLWINFSGFWIILAGEILYGLFKAFYRGNVDSYIYEYLESNNLNADMVKRYGKLSFYNSLGSAVSCFAGVILYKFYGFKTILYLELFTQIIALICLCFLPNIQTARKHRIKSKVVYYFRSVKKSIAKVIKNAKINYYVYYSAMLSGLTSVFVWNFQPLLKMSSAPVFLYGIVNFINQILRAAGGYTSKEILAKFSKSGLFVAEFVSVVLSFGLLIAGYFMKNCVFTVGALVLICFAIYLFVVFNIFTVSKVHEITYDYKRAVTSSANTFFEDFMSFFLLIVFKFLYDGFGFIPAISIFGIAAIICLVPNKKRILNSI